VEHGSGHEGAVSLVGRYEQYDLGNVSSQFYAFACDHQFDRHRVWFDRTCSDVQSRKAETWTAIFLVSTILTSVTGFFFHSIKFGPPHVFGVISLLVLAAAVAALYLYRLAGRWRWIYVVGALIALYLNVVVAVVQAFQKLPPLKMLAPTQTELPFLVTQLTVMALFIGAGYVAVKRFRPG
jgi:hypothetical protein